MAPNVWNTSGITIIKKSVYESPKQYRDVVAKMYRDVMAKRMLFSASQDQKGHFIASE